MDIRPKDSLILNMNPQEESSKLIHAILYMLTRQIYPLF